MLHCNHEMEEHTKVRPGDVLACEKSIHVIALGRGLDYLYSCREMLLHERQQGLQLHQQVLQTELLNA